jgi:hypothetical protein
MAELITPDSVETLQATLANLSAGQAVYISACDFVKLTGVEITEFASEGRLMMGNLAARANCTIETTDCTAVFTKHPTRPVSGVWPWSLKRRASARNGGGFPDQKIGAAG